jgi:dolichol-phosphate mannosyltransferase
MPSPIIVIPTYHELANLPLLTERIWASVPKATLLIVDDRSGDGTPDWVRRHPLFGSSLHLIERAEKMGLGSAYVAGLGWARREAAPGSAVVQMDADLSHDPAAIPSLLAEMEKGVDLVLATRYLGGVRVTNWPLTRLMLSQGAALYVRLLTGMPFSDPTGGFKAFRAERLAELDLSQVHSDGYAFQIEVTYMAWRLGWKISEVPITFEGRMAGASKMSARIVREAVWRVPWMAIWRRWARPQVVEKNGGTSA